MIFFILAVLSYLIGSVPFGMLASLSKGVDIRKVGSGNIGATNVLRSVGKGAALFALLGDLLKGTASVALGRHFGLSPLEQGILGLASIVGHDFSIFLGLRGGKGVATSLGVLLIYSPQACMLTVIIWLFVVIFTRYSSLGAIVAFGLLPPVMLALGYSKEKLAVAAAVSVLILFKHFGNINRLIKGTERRMGERA
jgi:glycerol-3-phosphate acyltransferase PlsY